jgi:hypothetical protein
MKFLEFYKTWIAQLSVIALSCLAALRAQSGCLSSGRPKFGVFPVVSVCSGLVFEGHFTHDTTICDKGKWYFRYGGME